MGRRSDRISQRLARLERAAPQGLRITKVVVMLPHNGGLTIETIPLGTGLGTGEITRRQASEAEAREYYENHLGIPFPGDQEEVMR